MALTNCSICTLCSKETPSCSIPAQLPLSTVQRSYSINLQFAQTFKSGTGTKTTPTSECPTIAQRDNTSLDADTDHQPLQTPMLEEIN